VSDAIKAEALRVGQVVAPLEARAAAPLEHFLRSELGALAKCSAEVDTRRATHLKVTTHTHAHCLWCTHARYVWRLEAPFASKRQECGGEIGGKEAGKTTRGIA